MSECKNCRGIVLIPIQGHFCTDKCAKEYARVSGEVRKLCAEHKASQVADYDEDHNAEVVPDRAGSGLCDVRRGV